MLSIDTARPMSPVPITAPLIKFASEARYPSLTIAAMGLELGSGYASNENTSCRPRARVCEWAGETAT